MQADVPRSTGSRVAPRLGGASANEGFGPAAERAARFSPDYTPPAPDQRARAGYRSALPLGVGPTRDEAVVDGAREPR
jgi:hypothetical protein